MTLVLAFGWEQYIRGSDGKSAVEECAGNGFAYDDWNTNFEHKKEEKNENWKPEKRIYRRRISDKKKDYRQRSGKKMFTQIEG